MRKQVIRPVGGRQYFLRWSDIQLQYMMDERSIYITEDMVGHKWLNLRQHASSTAMELTQNAHRHSNRRSEFRGSKGCCRAISGLRKLRQVADLIRGECGRGHGYVTVYAR